MKYFDVIIVGSGPAGSTAARFCSMAGLKTVIIEKEKLPRVKVCAGGIIPSALRFCNIELPDDIIERKCNNIRLEYKRSKTSVRIQEPIYMVERSTFDMFLTEEAIKMGTKLKENERLIGFRYEDDYLMSETTKDRYKSKILIGADGYFSTVRKNLGIAFNPKDSPVAIETNIPMENSEIFRKYDDKLFISYLPELMGYAWIFPKKGYISAGLGTFIKSKNHIKELFFNYLKSYGLKFYHPLRSWFIPPTNSSISKIYDRILLTGDAGGFVDAFTGEGIRYAMISGKLAAVAVIECFDKNDFSKECLAEYNKLCNKFIIPNLIYSKKISYYVYKYNWLTVPAALKSKKLLEIYANTLFGHNNYKNLVQWLKPRLPFIIMRRFLPF